MRMKTCPATHSPRKIAPYVSDTFDRTFDRWMNTPANPAVNRSEAGIRQTSSRLRALTSGPRYRNSLRDLPRLQVHHQRCRIRLRSQVVVQETVAPVGRNQRSGDPRGIEGLIQPDPGRQAVRQAAVDRDDSLLVGADEVELAGREVPATSDQKQHHQN